MEDSAERIFTTHKTNWYNEILTGIMHQLLRSSSKLHIEIGLLSERLLLHSETLRVYIFRRMMHDSKQETDVFQLLR
jgi:hypothetical protein